MVDENLLFYDIEVFRYDSLVVFKDIDHNTVGVFWNDRERTKCEIEGTGKIMDMDCGFEGAWDVIKDKTLVGYNNHHYDDLVLPWMLDGAKQKSIYSVSNTIIQGGDPYKKNKPFKSLDTMQQISVSTPSLKMIEGNMGMSIVESSIPFDIDRPLTDAERAETEKYCSHDVDATIEVYKLRKKAYFEPKESLVAMMDDSVRDKAMEWNTTTISAQVLLGKKNIKSFRSWNHLGIPEDIWRNVEGIPESVWDMWEQAEHDDNLKEYPIKSVTVKDFGCDILFAFGGIHGAPNKPKTYHDVRLLDVGSMYPSLIRMLDALGSATEKYDGIRKERLKIKHVDKVRSDALKLVLNSVYGNLRNRYSALFAPKASASVCIYGQIALYDLARDLDAAGAEIVNMNTDGVAFVWDGDTTNIVNQWQEKYLGMVLEEDDFSLWVQRDVNNYVAVVQGSDKIKVKGGDVNKYHVDKFFDNNNIRIVQIALVDYLIKGTPIIDTLIDNIDKPELFQYVLRAGRTYRGVYDENETEQNRVNRVFARRKGSVLPETKLYKMREDGGLVNFPDVPESMFIWNEDVRDLPNPEQNIDISHYHELIKNKLEGWGVNYVH